VEECGLDLSGSGWGQVAGHFEHGNKLLGFIIFLDQLSSCQFLKKDPAPCS
jgi:hypothetical protein